MSTSRNHQRAAITDKPHCPAVRGYLLHLTHYAPGWVDRKAGEKRFDLEVALELTEEAAAQGFNTLFIGVSDGVRYASHPEFRRGYSAPMKELAVLAARARQLGLDVVPKLNFSRSAINCHNNWMRAPDESWHLHFDDDYFWKTGFECIDEVIDACKPGRFFHVGMDEDHDRSYTQYVAAMRTLRAGLRTRGLRTVCWSDSALDYPSGQVYREKSERAEEELPHDTVRLLWNYWAVPRREMRRISGLGHELWGAPGKDVKHLRSFRDALLAAGGTGMVMTRWIACRRPNRAELLGMIRTLGPVYRGE
jgi:hypothetical protein